MSNAESHGLAVGVTVRRKPTLTYQSPAGSAMVLQVEKALITAESYIAPVLPTPPAPRHSQTPELSRGSRVTDKSRCHHMTAPLLPLYHPFGALALSLPDLDPTVFGLPAPVAVFDDPTRRYSNRQRRPAPKVRDAEEPVLSQPPSITRGTPAPESEVKGKTSPRRRRGGGKRRRKEAEDGDATYPAKRARHPRTSGVASGLPGTRGVSREEGSPALSNGTSPTLEGGRGEGAEEKKQERRTTRSQGAVVRRGSTTSEDTATSVSGPNNTATARVESSGEPIEGDGQTADTMNGVTAEAQKTESGDIPAS